MLVRNKYLLVAVLLAIAGFQVLQFEQRGASPPTRDLPAPTSSDAASDELQRAYEQRRSNVHVTARGTVTKLLADDHKGSRHQRFIVTLPHGSTVLIAHNIDLAPRINALETGDEVTFFGEYEWNDRGGVVHWTHHDPQRRHQDGWIEHRGKKYQ